MSSLDNVNVNVPSGCDNAPRKKVLIDVTLAFLTSDVDFVEKSLNPSAVWLKVASNEALTGVEQIIGKLKDSKEKPSEITILSVITHGKFASIDGVVNYSNGKPLSFCDVFTFTSASNKGVVKEVRSYHIRN